ncbi:MAG TPA: HesA/MoeB/ThiF family protein [Gammaproteobacteria bacterium]|nr:HesA/MoeB/ThiF family protein [Gammaproteobacteria bacterium]
MSPDSLRYARHLALPGFGAAQQARLKNARVLVVGLGGLGSPAAQYLAAAGVGTLVLNDFDSVDLTNLQRQSLYAETDVGAGKAEAACMRLAGVNSTLELLPLSERLQDGALATEVAQADLVVDATDNFGSRFALNAACVAAGTPLVSGAAIRYDGQLAVFDAGLPDSPCYACLYSEADEGLEDCAGNGVFAPVVGVIGAAMAVEALKQLTGLGETPPGTLWRYAGLTGEWRSARIARDSGCSVCGGATAKAPLPKGEGNKGGRSDSA